MNGKPRLTFVVAGRNDNYGGSFLHRAQVFLDGLVAQSTRFGLGVEVIFVDWNPPADKPPLSHALSYPRGPGVCDIRFITVPKEFHDRLPNSDRMPIFEYIAKNVGVRRAIGEFVVTTNPDILFSTELFRFLATRRLSDRSFYRVDRYDVDETLPQGGGIDVLEPICEQKWSRVNRFCGTWNRHAHRCKRCSSRGFEAAVFRVVEALKNNLRPWRKVWCIHGNAAGDFMLMSRSRWSALRGFPEIPMHSHIDSYMCALAIIFQRQVLLPYPIYHQEHNRNDHARRPLTDFSAILRSLNSVVRSGTYRLADLTPNSEQWGLGETELPEYRNS